jgi:hypothetical protein
MRSRPYPFILTLTLLGTFLLVGTPLHAQTHEYQVIVLHPPALVESEAFSINDTREVVGLGTRIGQELALIWTGAGTNFRSLNPGATFAAVANHIAGARVAGSVHSLGHPDATQAVVWDAYSSAMTSLHPSGFFSSGALGVDGDQVVGSGGGAPTSWAENALLWTTLTPKGFVNLNPAGFITSKAEAIDVA